MLLNLDKQAAFRIVICPIGFNQLFLYAANYSYIII